MFAELRFKCFVRYRIILNKRKLYQDVWVSYTDSGGRKCQQNKKLPSLEVFRRPKIIQYSTTVCCGLGRFGLRQFTGLERRKEVIVVLIPALVYVCMRMLWVFCETKDRARFHRSVIWCDVKKLRKQCISHCPLWERIIPDLEASHDGEAGHLQPLKISTYSKSISQPLHSYGRKG